MTKNFSAKQFIKQYPDELHPIAKEKMKCCNIISADWLHKLEKSLKSPFSHIPKNFGKSIDDLVDSDGKLLQNVKRGIDYELVTNFMFDNLSCLTDKDNCEVPPGIHCGLGHDPTTGEEVVVFDLVAFNIKSVHCNKRNSSSVSLNKTRSNMSSNFAGERWYASASWTFQDFLRQYCEVVNIDETTHRFYQDIALTIPIKLTVAISAYFKGTTGKITAHDLYLGAVKRSVLNRSMNTMVNKNRVNFEKSMPTPNNNINESSPFPSNNNEKNPKFHSVDTFSSSSSSSNSIKLETTKEFSDAKKVQTEDSSTSTTTNTATKSQNESKDNHQIHHVRDNSVSFQYRFSPSNDLIVPKLKPTGFINKENLSYMNSVIQCFIRIPAVSSFYFGDQYAQYINPTSILSSHGNISKEFHNMLNDIASLSYSQKVSYDLTNFRTAFINQYNNFNNTEQQNAHNFLICLIDGLHEDINQAFSTQKDRKKVLETLSPYESPWEVSQKLNKSKLQDIFLGMTETKFTCQVCSHTEIIQEPFFVLSLPIPSSGSHSMHIEDILKHYCQKVVLTKSDKVECKKCQKRTNTKKNLKIEKCSQIIIITLKRFDNNNKKGNSSNFKKNDINVIYPKILNLNPYSTNNIGKFKLIGCVYHYGSLESGHYTAASYDQLRDVWYTFDDTSVNETQEKNVHNSNAYILFYQKQ